MDINSKIVKSITPCNTALERIVRFQLLVVSLGVLECFYVFQPFTNSLLHDSGKINSSLKCCFLTCLLNNLRLRHLLKSTKKRIVHFQLLALF